VCDGNGLCVECNSPNQCANQGGVCEFATCASKVCGIGNVALNDPAKAGAQIQGDCKLATCNGTGQLGAPAVAASDLPFDNNECTYDLCNGGNPSNPPTPNGSACGNGGRCNGAGVCTGVNEPLGSPCANAAECASGQCVDGVCCESECGDACETCNAQGQCSYVPAGQDPDVECNATETCNGSGACGFTCGQSPTPPASACPAICNGGCVNGTCIISCSSGSPCTSQTKACPPGLACRVECSGSCSNTIVQCNDKYRCDLFCASGCGGAQLNCASGACGLTCGAGNACNVATTVNCGTNTCESTCSGTTTFPTVNCGSSCDCDTCQLPNGAPCLNGSQCASGQCPPEDDVCCDTACAGSCSSCLGSKTGGATGTCADIAVNTDPDSECSGPQVCIGPATCGLKPNGASCSANNQCTSGHCPAQDGVCCDLGCNGTCKSCLSTSTGAPTGTCTNVLGGTDPNNECAGALTCNGSGACN
jgi:hypothetical protein